MRILVTGGAGFIGSHYVRTLLAGGYPALGVPAVTVLDALTYAGNLANLAPVSEHPGYRFVHGDIRDAALLDELLPGHDAVVNFAAESHVDRSIRSAGAFIETNVAGTATLLGAALRAGTPRVVHVSTDEVYGSVETGASVETDPLEPNSPYSASKAAADLLARAYAVTYGLDVVVTRCTNNYGPYQFPEKLIPLFVTNLLDGQPVGVYGDGHHVRDWLHVDDHCRGIALALERGAAGEVYNIGGGTALSNLELTRLLVAACGAGDDQIRHVPDRLGHDRRYCLDDTKLRALGYVPAIPFDVGLAETVRWYAENEAWWRPLKGVPGAARASG